jgi:hypothetical protein
MTRLFYEGTKQMMQSWKFWSDQYGNFEYMGSVSFRAPASGSWDLAAVLLYYAMGFDHGNARNFLCVSGCNAMVIPKNLDARHKVV